MRFIALASDYDGTLASHGSVAAETWEAVRRWKASGRQMLLVTGRELDDLRRLCPHLELFERIVAENGGVLYRPNGEQEILACPPPRELVQALRQRGVAPLDVGRTILATVRPYATTLLQTIRELGLQWQIIYNKDAVMALPPGVNKASGLQAALTELGLSPRQVAAVGDAENDRAFFDLCGYSAAVANALPALKQHADRVTAGAEGRGVVELIDELLADDSRPHESD
jgi:hydroxymethylpyrimidine pyrophosphatase-like HAD family hydrolase